MRTANVSTVVGIAGGVLLLALIIAFTARDPLVYLNLPGLVFVLGGTFAAALVSFPMREIRQLPRLVAIVFRDDDPDFRKDLDELCGLARLWFRAEVKAIERELETVNNAFLKTGAQLVIDKTPLPDILELLNWRIARLKAAERAEARLFRTLAGFAPAFGMLGTLVGLVNTMAVLDSGDLSAVAAPMAIALVTTFYGVLLANLAFKPAAIKLERRTEQRVMLMTMVMEGIALMSEQRTPRFVRETLESFLANYEDELDHRLPVSPLPQAALAGAARR